MKNWTTKPLISGLMLAAMGLSTGCFFVDDDDGYGDGRPPLGVLTVEWTIDGQTNPADCAFFGVDRMELVIYEGPDIVDEVEPLCESFSVSIDMLDGIYYADATLVDSFDRAATYTLPIDDIDIIGGTELIIPVDFPLDLFR